MFLDTSGRFYSIYKKSNQDFDPSTFKCAESTVQKLIDIKTTSEHPGMLLGKVQSGKTRAFITILTLAFDNGFDVAIVLSKNSKALIEQTTKRLNKEFDRFIEEGELEVYDIMHAPEQYTQFELESKLVFVAKKQKDNLDRLIKILSKTCPAMSNKRILIVDDEADNASIGYRKYTGSEEIDATTIAKKISELRSQAEGVSFLQVTATPYSLYLQPQSVEVSNAFDFKPVRPAFSELVPVPDSYVGGDTYFGENAKSLEPTIESLIHQTVDGIEFDRLRKSDRRKLKVEELLTSNTLPGYCAAIINFIVGGCIQRLNGSFLGKSSKKLRYSLLLHSEAAKNSHSWQQEVTEKIIDLLADEAQQNTENFDCLIKLSYDDFSQSLVLNDERVPLFSEVKNEVKKALSNGYITIAKVNSDEDVSAMLDSSGQLKLRSPLNIFIGGQVLDRGVTLANLIGFYYGRRPAKYQQDTVLQHSRMYGYRKSDLAVTRFYTSDSIRNAMFKMEEFDSSLRAAIESDGDQTVQFIRKAENGSIVPCNPNKILLSEIQVLKPFKRILPIGFQTGYGTGKNGINHAITEIDTEVEKLCGFKDSAPTYINLEQALDLLEKIMPTLIELEETPHFDWKAAKDSLNYLSYLSNDGNRGKVLLWAAKNRNTSRKYSEKAHSSFGDAPDTPKK